MKYTVKDTDGKTLLTITDTGKIIVSRYEGLSEDLKDYMVSVYRDVTNDSEDRVEKMRKFLNFETTENEFCS